MRVTGRTPTDNECCSATRIDMRAPAYRHATLRATSALAAILLATFVHRYMAGDGVYERRLGTLAPSYQYAAWYKLGSGARSSLLCVRLPSVNQIFRKAHMRLLMVFSQTRYGR